MIYFFKRKCFLVYSNLLIMIFAKIAMDLHNVAWHARVHVSAYWWPCCEDRLFGIISE